MKALAQMPTWTGLESAVNPLTGQTGNADVATIGSLTSLFSNIVQAVTVLAGVVLFIMLIIGGYTFLFSGGDQKKLEKAKGTITNAIIGFVLLSIGYLILKLIEVVTGVNVTTFSIQTTP